MQLSLKGRGGRTPGSSVDVCLWHTFGKSIKIQLSAAKEKIISKDYIMRSFYCASVYLGVNLGHNHHRFFNDFGIFFRFFRGNILVEIPAINIIKCALRRYLYSYIKHYFVSTTTTVRTKLLYYFYI